MELVPPSGFRLPAGLVTINTVGTKGLCLYSQTAWLPISASLFSGCAMVGKVLPPPPRVPQFPHSVVLGLNEFAYLKG